MPEWDRTEVCEIEQQRTVLLLSHLVTVISQAGLSMSSHRG